MTIKPKNLIQPLCWLAGVQLSNILLSTTLPASSSGGCKWTEAAADAIQYRIDRVVNPPKIPAGFTEGEYNQLREVYKTDDIKLAAPTDHHSALPNQTAPIAPAPPSRDAHPSRTLTAESDLEIDRQIAASQGLTVEQYRTNLGL